MGPHLHKPPPHFGEVCPSAQLLSSCNRMGTTSGSESTEGDSGVATETRTKDQLKRPTLYRVLLHNDNYTTMEFVVWVLVTQFHKSEADAFAIMLSVHRTGLGLAGVYTRDVAETKIDKVHQLARENEFPLRLSMEPEES